MGDDEARSCSRRSSRGLRLAALLLICGGALQAQEQQGNIIGQIRLVNGSSPDERIQVSLEARGSVVDVAYSDSEGRFGFHQLLPNAYSVVIETVGYQTVRQQVIVNPTTSQTNFVHVVLRPKPDEKPRGAPDGPAGTNPEMLVVVER